MAMNSTRAREVEVSTDGLLAGALPRVDWSDAYGVSDVAGLPDDPQVWADAVFRHPPAWVGALLGLREALVGLVGIERAGSSAFDTIARTPDEVLLGTDQRHLDFRASVRREPDRVVVTKIVQVHNRRGRAYSMLVRRLHPAVVRTMVTQARERLATERGQPG
jgi:hypothetical protein